MKKLILIIVIFFASFGLRAEIFGSAGTIKPGVMMFGVEPQINIRPNDVMGYFHFGAGIIDRMNVNFKLGLGTAKTYFGGELEYEFIKTEPVDFSLTLGTHYQDAAFLEIKPIFTHRFLHFALSSGPYLDWQISKGTFLAVSWFAAASIPMTKSVELLFDGGVQIRGNKNWISGGIATYF